MANSQENDSTISQQIWFVLNKKNEILLFLDEPIKNPITKKWEGNKPYINSRIHKEVSILAQQAQMSFESDPECIEVQFKKK